MKARDTEAERIWEDFWANVFRLDALRAERERKRTQKNALPGGQPVTGRSEVKSYGSVRVYPT